MNGKRKKVILVGDGAVGSSYAFALVNQGLAEELGIVEIPQLKAKSEADAYDLQHALPNTLPKHIFSAEYADAKDADLVVITAGVPQKPGETRLELVDKNLKINKDIVTQVVASGFQGIFLVIANPVDILTYSTYKFSGFPKNRVFGTGTSLDTARLRQAIGDTVNIDPRSVDAYIMGEHGDSEFAAWSQANVAGVSATALMTEEKGLTQADFDKMEDEVIHAAYSIINGKGATYYGIAAAAARITEAILHDQKSVLAASVLQEGQYGITDCYIGQPAVIGANGVEKVINLPLSAAEKVKMETSAKGLKAIIDEKFPAYAADFKN